MQNFNRGQVSFGESAHDDPGGARARFLAAAAEDPLPCLDDAIFELVDGLTISWDGMVVQPPTYNRGQPPSWLDEGRALCRLKTLAGSTMTGPDGSPVGHLSVTYRSPEDPPPRGDPK